MSNIKDTAQTLVDRIMQTAEEEAAAILESARTSIDRRRTALKQRTDSIRRAAAERVERQKSKLVSAADAAIESARNRFRLSTQKRVYQLVEDRAAEEILALRGSDEYPEIMRRWISEAAGSLGTTDVVLVCPPEDRETVEKVVQKMNAESSGRGDDALTLSLDETLTPTGQGVVARDRSGRIAFSNLVADRLRRYGPALHTMIYHTVIEGRHDQ
jgi:vacuolar-type H+-ATPase subunit E/Vma4